MFKMKSLTLEEFPYQVLRQGIQGHGRVPRRVPRAKTRPLWFDEKSRVSWSRAEGEGRPQNLGDRPWTGLQFRILSGRKRTDCGGSEPVLREAVLWETEGTSAHCDEAVRRRIRRRHERSGGQQHRHRRVHHGPLLGAQHRRSFEWNSTGPGTGKFQFNSFKFKSINYN